MARLLLLLLNIKCRTRINVRNEPITTLVHKHEQQIINVKHKSKGREM